MGIGFCLSIIIIDSGLIFSLFLQTSSFGEGQTVFFFSTLLNSEQFKEAPALQPSRANDDLAMGVARQCSHRS
jgi:hypothetical protein